MQRDAQPDSSQTIDREAVANIARQVLARLAVIAQQEDATAIDDRVVSVESLRGLPGGTKQLAIHPNAVVTPAAGDEARDRGITLLRIDHTTNPERTTTMQVASAIRDTEQPERSAAIQQQLDRRGVDLGTHQIILSDTPAREVWQQCTSQAERAVMVSALDDVNRFAEQLDPTVWVLDMKRLNLIAAVNVIAAITRTGSQAK